MGLVILGMSLAVILAFPIAGQADRQARVARG